MGTAWLGEEGVVIHDACFSYKTSLNPKFVAYFTRTKQFHDQIKKHISSGKISAKQMRNAMFLFAFLSLVATLVLLYKAFFPDFINEFYTFIGLGVACILAAIGYTVGKKPYGYLGLGDIFVFIFFVNGL